MNAQLSLYIVPPYCKVVGVILHEASQVDQHSYLDQLTGVMEVNLHVANQVDQHAYLDQLTRVIGRG